MAIARLREGRFQRNLYGFKALGDVYKTLFIIYSELDNDAINNTLFVSLLDEGTLYTINSSL